MPSKASGSEALAGEQGEIGLGKRLRLAHMAFSRALREELAKEKMTFGQFVHLERLWEEDGLTQTELSARVGVETASSTIVLDELQRLALIDRKRDDDDRRRINVFLTDAGRRLKRQLLGRVKVVNRVAREGMSKDEVALTFEVLDQIKGRLLAKYPQPARAGKRDRLGA
jgi:DNA-binding MarR family transcriptional regulator